MKLGHTNPTNSGCSPHTITIFKWKILGKIGLCFPVSCSASDALSLSKLTQYQLNQASFDRPLPRIQGSYLQDVVDQTQNRIDYLENYMWMGIYLSCIAIVGGGNLIYSWIAPSRVGNTDLLWLIDYDQWPNSAVWQASTFSYTKIVFSKKLLSQIHALVYKNQKVWCRKKINIKSKVFSVKKMFVRNAKIWHPINTKTKGMIYFVK